jgi:hypothetical protein
MSKTCPTPCVLFICLAALPLQNDTRVHRAGELAAENLAAAPTANVVRVGKPGRKEAERARQEIQDA